MRLFVISCFSLFKFTSWFFSSWTFFGLGSQCTGLLGYMPKLDLSSRAKAICCDSYLPYCLKFSFNAAERTSRNYISVYFQHPWWKVPSCGSTRSLVWTWGPTCASHLTESHQLSARGSILELIVSSSL